MISNEAWGVYHRRLYIRAASLVGPFEAEDIVQEVICNYLLRVRRLPVITNPFLYLWGAVTNRSVSHNRRPSTGHGNPYYLTRGHRIYIDRLDAQPIALPDTTEGVADRLDREAEIRRLRLYPEWGWLLGYYAQPKPGSERIKALRARRKLAAV